MTTVDAALPTTALQRALILGTATLATMLYSMTVTIANVALPQMQGSLSATQDQIAWVVTFNIVATAVATPMTGWLVSRLGRRMVMLGSVLLFTTFSLLCGTADSLVVLVLYRVAQGAFGAPLVPLSQAIMLDTYPRHQHATVTAIFGMAVVLGPIFAPTVGGYLSETYNWRWAFFMIVPFGAVALLGVWVFITDDGRKGNAPLDWTGFLALSLTVACLQLMLDRGERHDWFESPEIIAEAAIAGICLYLFIVHSLTAERPFLTLRLLLDRNYALGLMIAFVFGALNHTQMVLLPPMMQDLKGFPDSVIGWLIASRGIGALAAFTSMAFLNRFDPRVILVAGFTIQALSGWYMASFDINVPALNVATASAIQGLGMGLTWVPLTVITFATLNPRHLPETTAVFHLVRTIGSSIFISISVTVVIRTGKLNYAGLA